MKIRSVVKYLVDESHYNFTACDNAFPLFDMANFNVINEVGQVISNVFTNRRDEIKVQ